MLVAAREGRAVAQAAPAPAAPAQTTPAPAATAPAAGDAAERDDDSRAVALDRFEPTEPFSLFSSVDSPLADRRAAWSARLLGSYASHPLTLQLTDGERVEVVRSQGVLHAQLAIQVVDGWSFDVDLPSTWSSAGQPVSIEGRELAAPGPVTLHDLRLGSRLAVSRALGWIPGVGLSARVWLPTGDDQSFTSAGRARYALHGLIGADIGAWAYRVALGRSGHGARAARPLLPGNSELGVALGYRPLAELLLGGELELMRVAGDEPSVAGAKTHAQLLASASYARGPWALRLGAGPGLGSALGTPRWRVIASIAFAAEADADESAGMGVTMGQVGAASPAPTGVASALASTPPPSPTRAPGPPAKSKPAAPVAAEQHDGAGPSDGPRPSGTSALESEPAASEPASLRGDQLELEGEVLFGSGSDAIDPASDALLLAVAQLLDGRPEIVRVAVAGHTDDVGSEHDNLILSQRRAIAVVRRLVTAGVDERRLQARGLGPRQPKQSNDTEAGRVANRRVEFIVIHHDPAGRRSWRDGLIGEGRP